LKNRLLILLFVIGLGGATVEAQKNDISPYSRYGIGNLRNGKTVRNHGLAGTGIALRSDNHINLLNPASYDSIRLTSFEAGVQASNQWLNGGGESQYKNNNYFSHLLFGIPIMQNRWGMVFGMMPISTVGYEYQTQAELGAEVGTVTNLFEGAGGLNKLMVGNGFRLLPNLSVGVNASYLLGKLDYKERIIYEDLSDGFNTRKTNKYTVGDLQLDFGLQHRTRLEPGLDLITGATFAFASEMKAKQSLLVESYTGDIGFERIKDTVENAFEQRTFIRMPNQVGLGFALEKRNAWVLTLDLDYADWSNTTFNNSETFSDAWNVRTGWEIQRSDFNRAKGRLRNSERHYRIGARYGTSYITIDGDAVTEMAASIGYSLYGKSKIGSNETIRGLNFGMEIGTRGKDNNVMIQERFINLIFAITINDRWFIQRKYD
jgi:hypothetical protein